MIRFSLENYGVAAAGFRTKGFPQMKTGEEKSLFKDTGLFEAEKQAVLDSLYEIKETEAEFDDDGQEVKPACSYYVLKENADYDAVQAVLDSYKKRTFEEKFFTFYEKADRGKTI